MHLLHTSTTPLSLVHPPIGPGLVAFELDIDPEDEVVLWGFLLGDDGLASAHGDTPAGTEPRRVVLLTTESRARELDAWIDEVAPELPSLRRAPLATRGAFKGPSPP